MKTKTILFLCVISLTVIGMMMGISGCRDGESDLIGSLPQSSDTDGDAAALAVVSAGVSEYKIIRADTGYDDEVRVATDFRQAVRTVTGCDLSMGTDWYANESEIGQNEILFGTTGRPESVAAMSELNALPAGEYAFIVRVVGTKLVIAGSSPSMLARAAEYIKENYMSVTGLSFPADLDYKSESFFPTPADHIKGADEISIEMEQLCTVSPVGKCKNLQGGCTDGKYLYMVMNDGATVGATSAIVKIDPATGKIVKTTTGFLFDHGNDLCYNPDTNRIIAVHNAPDRQKISVYDADTLDFISTVSLSLEIYSMSYDEETGKYWVGISYGYNFACLNSDFSVEKVYPGLDSGFTKQGMDLDGDYIYFVQYKTNCIEVYDKQGVYIRRLSLPVTAGEPENICHIGDTFYINYNSPSWTGAIIYKANVVPSTTSGS